MVVPRTHHRFLSAAALKRLEHTKRVREATRYWRHVTRRSRASVKHNHNRTLRSVAAYSHGHPTLRLEVHSRYLRRLTWSIRIPGNSSSDVRVEVDLVPFCGMSIREELESLE